MQEGPEFKTAAPLAASGGLEKGGSCTGEADVLLASARETDFTAAISP